MEKIKLEKDRYHLHQEIQEWCKINIGKGTWFEGQMSDPEVKWHVAMMFGTQIYTFKDESDALFFILKWS